MKLYGLFICFLILCLPSFGQDWKRVEMELFAVEIPAHWVSRHGDTLRIANIEEENFREYSIWWDSPEGKHPDTWDKAMALGIKCYKSLDASPLSYSRIQELAIATPSKVLELRKEMLDNGKIKFVELQENKSISQGKVKYKKSCRHILLLQSGNMIYVLTVRLGEDLLKELPEKQKEIERILNSFEVK